MKSYKKRSGMSYCNYFSPPLSTPKKEPDPLQHHYVNAIFNLLLNLDGQGMLEGNADAYDCLNLQIIDLRKLIIPYLSILFETYQYSCFCRLEIGIILSRFDFKTDFICFLTHFIIFT